MTRIETTNPTTTNEDSLTTSSLSAMTKGNGSGLQSGTQANKQARTYLSEVSSIFGKKNVCIPADDTGNTIIARKSKYKETYNFIL